VTSSRALQKAAYRHISR